MHFHLCDGLAIAVSIPDTGFVSTLRVVANGNKQVFNTIEQWPIVSYSPVKQEP